MTSAKLPSFLEEADIGGRNKKSSVEGEAAKDLKTELSELQVQFVDAINELEKTRSLLRVQVLYSLHHPPTREILSSIFDMFCRRLVLL